MKNVAARLAALLLAAVPPPSTVSAAAAEAPPIRCQGQADPATPVSAGPDRKVYCAIDLGSNSAKLQVLSMEPERALSFRGERECRARLGFGAIVFDSKTKTAGPLPDADIERLLAVMREFQAICAVDGGTMVGVEATQWARDATNVDEVQAAVKAATHLTIDVLTTAQEGEYGYVAAAHDAPGRFSLDPGSNSFQLAWWPKGAARPQSVSVPFGYVRGGKTYYDAASEDSCEAARSKHTADLKAQIEAALQKATPPTSLGALKASAANGDLRPELFILGQDGALHLAVRGELRDADGTWADTQTAYEARLNAQPPRMDKELGQITTVLEPEELTRFFALLTKTADCGALRVDPVRSLYGERSLSNAALLELLVRELGLTKVVLVPQEMPAGYILARLSTRQ
jgi:hypothetical protein